MTRSSTSADFIRCPQCQARVASDTRRCDCGYLLEAANTGHHPGNEDLLGKADRLYGTYLNARIMRARKAVIDLRARRLRNLRDDNLGRQLRAAEKELRALEMQAMTQNNKEDESVAVPERPAARDDDAITEVIEPPDDMEDTITLSPEPTEAFRRSQAARAAGSPRPGTVNEFTEAQTRRAESAVSANEESRVKVCPECEATLSPAAQQCVCGYSFRLSKRRRPFLSEKEMRALRNR